MASCGARQLTLNPQVLDGRRLPTLRRLGAHLRPRLGALIGRVSDAIIGPENGRLLTLASVLVARCANDNRMSCVLGPGGADLAAGPITGKEGGPMSLANDNGYRIRQTGVYSGGKR